MRCDVCFTWMYPFKDIFDMKPMTMYSLCESCFSKHPFHIDIETMPNEGSLTHIMHIHYDGAYHINAYAFLEDACLIYFSNKDVTIIVLENLDDTILEFFAQCRLGMIWILHYNTQ